MTIDVRQELGIDELRSRFLPFTREAFARIPSEFLARVPEGERPRILDIGCGSGTSTLELARLSDAEIVGFDIDEVAVNVLKKRVEEEGLSDRVRAFVASLRDNGLPDQSFDVLWEEGVVHILDLDRALAECHRLAKPGGFLVSGEAMYWSGSHLDAYAKAGFELVERLPWPSGCWWTLYYGPLEERVRVLRYRLRAPEDIVALRPYEAEIAMVKADLAKTDCAHCLFKRAS
jgi:SAM-dependent methyltransferase